MTVSVKRMRPINAHDGQKFVRLIGKVPGSPESTWKTRTVSVAALVSGDVVLTDEVAKLAADVEEYHRNFLALREQLEGLQNDESAGA